METMSKAVDGRAKAFAELVNLPEHVVSNFLGLLIAFLVELGSVYALGSPLRTGGNGPFRVFLLDLAVLLRRRRRRRRFRRSGYPRSSRPSACSTPARFSAATARSRLASLERTMRLGATCKTNDCSTRPSLGAFSEDAAGIPARRWVAAWSTGASPWCPLPASPSCASRPTTRPGSAQWPGRPPARGRRRGLVHPRRSRRALPRLGIMAKGPPIRYTD